MSERLIEKIDRLGAEAGVETMTPEIRRFALLVRQDTVAQWPKRAWVDLTDEPEQELTEKEKISREMTAEIVAARALAQPDQKQTGIREIRATETVKQEQKPVAWMTPHGEGFRIRFSQPTNDVPLGWDALYTTPPKRQPLTDAQKQAVKFEITVKQSGASIGDFDYLLELVIKATEAAYDIKELNK